MDEKPENEIAQKKQDTVSEYPLIARPSISGKSCKRKEEGTCKQKENTQVNARKPGVFNQHENAAGTILQIITVLVDSPAVYLKWVIDLYCTADAFSIPGMDLYMGCELLGSPILIGLYKETVQLYAKVQLLGVSLFIKRLILCTFLKNSEREFLPVCTANSGAAYGQEKTQMMENRRNLCSHDSLIRCKDMIIIRFLYIFAL